MSGKVIQIAAQANHSLALLDDGTVKGWGEDKYGQITIPDFGKSKVTQIAAGIFHTLALLDDGTVCGWGGGTQYIWCYNSTRFF